MLELIFSNIILLISGEVVNLFTSLALLNTQHIFKIPVINLPAHKKNYADFSEVQKFRFIKQKILHLLAST